MKNLQKIIPSVTGHGSTSWRARSKWVLFLQGAPHRQAPWGGPACDHAQNLKSGSVHSKSSISVLEESEGEIQLSLVYSARLKDRVWYKTVTSGERHRGSCHLGLRVKFQMRGDGSLGRVEHSSKTQAYSTGKGGRWGGCGLLFSEANSH